jgi:hypothetical protein
VGGSHFVEITPEWAGDLLPYWGWNLPPGLITTWKEAKAAAEPPGETLPLSRVVLRGPSDPPLVRGKEKEPLNIVQFNVIKALIDANPDGLGKDELVRKSGHSDARRVLDRLRKKDPDWGSVIIMPGKPHRRYRILC